tara:strand:- start:2472 stop:3215 length:744 start_codon:yes stop_codon:yes gene_type:complete
MIPRLVGREGKSLKQYVIHPSWSLYKALPSEEKAKDDLPKDTHLRLVVRIEEDGEKCKATITTASANLRKFAIHNLKEQEKFHNKPRRVTFKMYSGLPHDKIGVLVGRGGTRLREMKQKASYNMPETLQEKYAKTFVKVERSNLKYSQVTSLVESSKDGRIMMLGWGPDDKENVEIIEIRVQIQGDANEALEFVQYLSEEMGNTIDAINERLNRDRSDALDILNSCGLDHEGISEEEDDEGYSPASP